MNDTRAAVVWLLLVFAAPAGGQAPPGVARADCFPLDRLAPPLRERAESLLLDLLDREGLYTFAGVKPVSDNFWTTRFRLDPPDLGEVETVRQALAAFRCGDEFYADVLVFDHVDHGTRFASACFVHRSALRQLIQRRADVFGRLGLTPTSHPAEILVTVERRRDPAERWRAFGLLFGYPEHAIEFFVRAGLHQRETGEFIERDFLHIPTHRARQGNFVYAVPKRHRERDEDRALRERCEPILADYRCRREKYIGAEKPGVVELIRDWLDDGTGHCRPLRTQAP